MTVLPWRGTTARERAKALHPSNGSRVLTGADADPGRRATPPVAALWNDAVCRNHLACAEQGLLSCPSSGVLDLLVPFALTRLGVVLVPTAALGEPGPPLSGRVVTLEVSGRAAGAGRWVVRLTGTAVDRLLVPDGPAGLRELGLRPGNGPGGWAPAHGGLAALAIPVDTIGGYQRTSTGPAPRRPARRS